MDFAIEDSQNAAPEGQANVEHSKLGSTASKPDTQSVTKRFV